MTDPTFSRFWRGLILCAALGASAQAACQLDSASATLPTYVPTTGAASLGSLTVRVVCSGPNDAFALQLAGARDTAGSAGAAALTLYQHETPFYALISGAAPRLRGQTLRGTQTLTFDLSAPPGQWVAAGPYQAVLNLTLTDLP